MRNNGKKDGGVKNIRRDLACANEFEQVINAPYSGLTLDSAGFVLIVIMLVIVIGPAKTRLRFTIMSTITKFKKQEHAKVKPP